MHNSKATYRPSDFVFVAGLVLVTAVFGVRAKYPSLLYDALGAIQFVIVAVSAWRVGACVITADAEDAKRMALIGILLVVPCALLAFLPGIGPPGDQTHAENALRYLILLVNSIAVAVGLTLLKEALADAGEKFYSTLGFSAIVPATAAYLIWASVAVGYFRWADSPGSGSIAPGIALMGSVLDVLLFFGGALTYVSTAAFAASLGRTQWLGAKATRAFVIASLFALGCLLVRGLQFPVRATAMTHWSTIPGFVVGIPAVPWMMPLLFGVVLLRRAERMRRAFANEDVAGVLVRAP